MSKSSRVAPFSLEGRFLGFVADGYKLKLMRLATATGDYTIKLPKELRPVLYRTLKPGEWVQVEGYQKLNDGRVKLKAEQVIPAGVRSGNRTEMLASDMAPVVSPIDRGASAPTPQPGSRSKAETILVCQKSDCCKRGGSTLVKALQSELAERGLTDQITIRGTGCMKRCKAGPNLVMPDKTRYTRIQADQVSALLDHHFSAEVAS